MLAGPILRRAEQKQVCIWVACSRPARIKAEIYRASDLDRPLDDHVKPIGTGISKPVRLGENLYVSLVVAVPAGDNSKPEIARNGGPAGASLFPADELLAYDIEILETETDNPGFPQTSGKRLGDLGLAGGRNSLAYVPFSLPTFFLRAREDSTLNILHGSCRKLHGKGHDCLALADEVIAASLQDLNQRPSALFLTGDQVYADDVAGPLIHYLTRFGIRLLGREERIDGIPKLPEIKIGERQQIVQQYAKFTSGSAGNHLLSFGEFAAMYLVAWNPENWPKAFPVFEGHPDKEQAAKYDMEIRQLENARKVLPAIRRVLANIPTYMIFDDHEITDDWNITREWRDNVQSSRCGRQVIANGLAAYWVFQAWGNDPALYGQERMFPAGIQQYLAGGQADDKSFQDHFLNIGGWTFACPVTPVTVFLDSRTQRSYDSFDGPPRLVNGQGLKSLVDAALNSGYKKGDPLLIVTPTPVFGFDLVEKFQELLAMVSGVYKVDLETWSANRKGFSSLLKSVMYGLAPNHCIFLSGDVHYGFTSDGTFSLFMQEEKGGSLSMNVTQLNSSALKTTSLGKEVALGAMIGRVRQLFYPRPSVMKPRTRDEAQSAGFEDPVENPERFGLHVLLGRARGANIVQRFSTAEWMAQKSFVNLSGSVIPHLIIADNNIGLVAIDEAKRKISQKLLVKNDDAVQICRTNVPLNSKVAQKNNEASLL